MVHRLKRKIIVFQLNMSIFVFLLPNCNFFLIFGGNPGDGVAHRFSCLK